ncbi:MAG: tetratricopeptide repeat protein [Pseudonocardiales bacterium]|nr:tetratricopeptide repeat protein [Pseudonocardiales bacterium]
MGLVFVNYRMVDTIYGVDAVAALLVEHLGREQIFLDHDSMRYGDDFPPTIRAALERCDALVAIMGPRWLEATDSSGNRMIDRERDWVREEIARALDRGIPVVPVLLRGAEAPTADKLPADITRLAYRQRCEISFERLDDSVRRLVENLVHQVPALLLPQLFEHEPQLPPRHLPSALLRAEYEVVPFEHRGAELDQLCEWANGQVPVASLLITGSGGQGKTRLARRLCAELREHGWVAGILARDLSTETLSRVCRLEARMLLVIDYAEGRTEQAIAAVQAFASRSNQTSARLLLLSRSAGEWQQKLHDAEDDAAAAVLAEGIELPLSPLVSSAGRTQEFIRALNAFAQRYNASTAGISTPNDLDHPRFDNTLDIHASALASLLDQLEPDGRGPAWRDPVWRVLRHEHVYWEQTSAVYELSDPHRDRLDQVVAAATLCGAPDRDAARLLLAALPTFAGQSPDVVERFLRWCRDLYPGAGVLNGMRPDRLGEDHIAATLDRNPALATAVVVAASGDQAGQALTVLARAVARHARLAEVIERVLRCEPERLLPLGIRVVTQLTDSRTLVSALTLVAVESDSVPLLHQLVGQVSPSSIALAEFSARIARRALDVQRSAGEVNPVVTARLLSTLGNRLLQLDDFDDALLTLADAVREYRQLATGEDPQAQVDLAQALSDLSDSLYIIGQHEDAVDRAQEAVELLRPLAVLDWDQYGGNLVATLTNLGTNLLALGQHHDALSILDEAVLVSTESDDSEWLPLLAHALHQQGAALGALGRIEEACSVTEHSVQIYRQLSDESPDDFSDTLAETLGDLSGFLHDLLRMEDALAVSQQAVEVARTLVATYGQRYDHTLAHAHNNRGIVLGQQGMHAQAEVELHAAVKIFRRLADRRPDAYLHEVGKALGNRALHLRALGQLWQALDEDTESADIFRKLAGPRPDAHQPDLIEALIRLFLDHSELEQLIEAHETISEAVRLSRELMATNPELIRPKLATALGNLAESWNTLGEEARAVPPAAESLRLHRALARRQPQRFQEATAHMAQLLGILLSSQGRYRKACHAQAEAIGRYRQLETANPGAFRVHLADTYTNLSVDLRNLGKRRGGVLRATRACRTAIGIYRDLMEDGHDCGEDLARALNNLAGALTESGQLGYAIEIVDEAVTLLREEYTQRPDFFAHLLCDSLRHQALLLGYARQPDLFFADITDGSLRNRLRRDAHFVLSGLDMVDPAEAAVRILAEAYEVACRTGRDDLQQAVCEDLIDHDDRSARLTWKDVSGRPFPLA